MKFGLKAKVINQLNDVFAGYPQVQQVILYGSRAKGNFRQGSDIDLTLKGDHLDFRLLNQITQKIDDLLLPFIVDVSIYHTIDNKDLIDHIERVGKIFYQKKAD